MSYDYDALVSKALDFRHRAMGATAVDDSEEKMDLSGDDEPEKTTRMDALQGAMTTFDELSQHCPMTPRLWILYGATAFQFCQELVLQNDAIAQEQERPPSHQDPTSTANSMETQIQILQLGLQEFPGSLLLHLRYVYVLQWLRRLTQSLPQPEGQELNIAFERAIELVGSGSFSDDGSLVVSHFYTPLAKLYASQKRGDDLFRLLVRDQARRPVPNDEVVWFYQKQCKTEGISLSSLGKPDDQVDHSRRFVAKLYNGIIQLQHYEAEIQSILHANQLLPPWNLIPDNHNEDGETETNGEDEFWKVVADRADTSPTFGMGHGGVDLAESFVSLARALHNIPESLSSVDDEINEDAVWQQMVGDATKLCLSVYERGVAECPTVELIWLSYLDYLELRVASHHKESGGDGVQLSSSEQLVSVAQRACRNCPYSLVLAERQLHIQGFLADNNFVILDPDKLMTEMVKPAVSSKFLPSEHATGKLYLAVLRIIQRRIFSLVVSEEADLDAFDIALDPSKRHKLKLNNRTLPHDVWTEIQDLCQDWIDLSSTMEEELAKSNNKVSATTRSVLFEQRAASMQHVIQPVLHSSCVPRTTVSDDTVDDDILRFLQKAVKLQNPCHPDTQLSYIRHYFLGKVPPTNAVDVVIRLCNVRFLFHSAVSATANMNNTNSLFIRDHHTAFRQLADEWMQFEDFFGSQKSSLEAKKVIQKKLGKFHADADRGKKSSGKLVTSSVNVHTKVEKQFSSKKAEMTLPEDNPSEVEVSREGITADVTTDIIEQHRPAKKARVSLGNQIREAEIDGKHVESGLTSIAEDSKFSVDLKTVNVVKVGNLVFPAHPFTVRVSNLAEGVQDMDLVDLFQSSKTGCGRLVHARVVREKKGKSKGWALVQFEERDGVDKALELDGRVGLHERIISVQRSHTPAVPSIVPPGMHRVKPQGQGKFTKRNEKKKTIKHENHVVSLPNEESTGDQRKQQNFATLGLIPRGIRKSRN